MGFDKVVVGINTLNNIFNILPDKLCKAAGLPRKTAHCLRITCASNLFEQGVEEKIIRERTGHKSSALTRYERPAETQLQRASAALAPVSSTNAELPSFDFSFDFSYNDILSEIEMSAFERDQHFVSDDILSQIAIPDSGNVPNTDRPTVMRVRTLSISQFSTIVLSISLS